MNTERLIELLLKEVEATAWDEGKWYGQFADQDEMAILAIEYLENRGIELNAFWADVKKHLKPK